MPTIRTAARAAGKAGVLVNLSSSPIGLVSEMPVKFTKADVGPSEALMLEALQA
tara:strand:- start:5301 stop:5462 length:162 start_codon:yes stop_codon:yes gene_type:complete